MYFFFLRLDGSNRFSGDLQQDCLGTFPEIFWDGLILCSLQCRKPVGHLCCELYCFVFLEFLEIQRRNAVLSLSFTQPDFQRRHKQLMVCVTVCSRICATVHKACFPSVRNWDVVYLIPYFYFRFILPTTPCLKLIWPSIPKLLRSCCWPVAWPCDLDFWPYDLDQLSYLACHV